jgi:hypothetical protein
MIRPVSEEIAPTAGVDEHPAAMTDKINIPVKKFILIYILL